MRKLIIEFQPNDFFKNALNKYIPFDKVESIDILELLEFDIIKREKIHILEVTMKKDYAINEFILPKGSEILYILGQKNNKYLCLVKWKIFQNIFDGFKKLMNKELNVMRDKPNKLFENLIIVGVIADQKNIKYTIQYIKKIGTINKINYVTPKYQRTDFLSHLTDKQRNAILSAKKHGYYNYPRKINSEKLAEKLGISTPTIIEHLRKAEIRLLDQILTGY